MEAHSKQFLQWKTMHETVCSLQANPPFRMASEDTRQRASELLPCDSLRYPQNGQFARRLDGKTWHDLNISHHYLNESGDVLRLYFDVPVHKGILLCNLLVSV